jgi:hypothetical protein
VTTGTPLKEHTYESSVKKDRRYKVKAWETCSIKYIRKLPKP